MGVWQIYCIINMQGTTTLASLCSSFSRLRNDAEDPIAVMAGEECGWEKETFQGFGCLEENRGIEKEMSILCNGEVEPYIAMTLLKVKEKKPRLLDCCPRS